MGQENEFCFTQIGVHKDERVITLRRLRVILQIQVKSCNGYVTQRIVKFVDKM